MKAKGVCAIL